MTVTLPEARRIARHRRALAYWAVILAWYGSILLGASLSPPRWLHMVALVAHLGSVVVGLGGALMVEYQGLLWATGRQTVRDVARVERPTTALIWLGILGLFGSGALLHPDLANPFTVLKLAAVLLVGLNGVAVTRLTRELSRLPASARFRSLPPRLRRWCLTTAATSQVAWWTAVIVGTLNTAGR